MITIMMKMILDGQKVKSFYHTNIERIIATIVIVCIVYYCLPNYDEDEEQDNTRDRFY